jgi:hypothetical protein
MKKIFQLVDEKNSLKPRCKVSTSLGRVKLKKKAKGNKTITK